MLPVDNRKTQRAKNLLLRQGLLQLLPKERALPVYLRRSCASPGTTTTTFNRGYAAFLRCGGGAAGFSKLPPSSGGMRQTACGNRPEAFRLASDDFRHEADTCRDYILSISDFRIAARAASAGSTMLYCSSAAVLFFLRV